jgi:hypothetical protein
MSAIPRKRPDTPRTRALSTWHSAARLVAECWDDCLVADRAGRPGAYAAYGAALDLEAAAANDLAALGRLA